MKNLRIIIITLFSVLIYGQEKKELITSQISVSGEGIIRTVPDQGTITIGVVSTKSNPKEAKEENDIIVEKILKFIKKQNIPESDFQTTHVNLNKNYDYQKKTYHYVANQTVTILLKDLKKYNDFMMGITDTGVTNINGIEFKSSQFAELEAKARKNAILNAKQKALDYVSVLNQEVGKAILISDNSQPYYQPQMLYKGYAMEATADSNSSRETLAIGEIEIKANVQVTFELK